MVSLNDQTQKLKLWWNSNYDKTQKIKLCQNSTQIMTELKNSNSNNTKNKNCAKTQKIKLWQLKKSNCDKTWRLSLWLISKNQIETKLKKLNYDKTKKNAKTDTVTKHEKNSKCDKTQLKLWPIKKNKKKIWQLKQLKEWQNLET